MWPLILSLFVVSSTVSATSSPGRGVPSPDLKFSCPKTLSQSLCCSNDLQSNGAVKDCQESRYLIPNPDGEDGNAAAMDRCTASQMNAGYDTPVCCATQVRTFKFDKGAPVFIGVNCMDAEDVRVGLEKREMPAEAASKTVPQEVDYTKYTKISPLDHRQEVAPTTTRPHIHPVDRIRGLPTARPHAVEDVRANSAETPVSLWRPRSAKKQARRNLKRASRSKNSVANTIMNDLNSASSRAIVRNAGPKARRNVAAQVAGRAATKKQTQSQSQSQTRDLTGLGKLTSLLGGLSSLSKGAGSMVKRLVGTGRREVANMVARIV